MNVIIPKKRRDGLSSFTKLVGYISIRDDKPHTDEVIDDVPKNAPSQASHAVFDRLVDYIDRSSITGEDASVLEELSDGRQRVVVGGVPCETNCFSWETAAAEMNLIAAQNRHCKDPVYHFILSWQEHESPTEAQIFESAQECLEAIGMKGHQYVTAIHYDTDNVHCHVAVNRVNPDTLKAKNLWMDASKLQKACRILERKHGFAEDNGSWVWSDRDTLVPAPFRFPGAPQGAAKTQTYSDTESLFHYAERTVRDGLDEIIGRNEASWDEIHHKLHERGLGLREQGRGLVVYDVLNPTAVPVKASTIHPSLTKGRLEQHIGQFTPAPRFESEDILEGRYGVLETYQPKLSLRDQDARDERRHARAEARELLKDRYQAYRNGWIKPDLNIQAREHEIVQRCRSMKLQARRTVRDPLLRKLMYRVAEFEQIKAKAELRIQLREERAELKNKGLNRPLTYRTWVEQQALLGDTAAVSQLRGWAYREKRAHRARERDTDAVIVAGAADDTMVFDAETHASRLRRDGTIEYLRYGQIAVVDRGETLEIKSGFDDADDLANYGLAVAIMAHKSGERAEVLGEEVAVRQVMEAGLRHAQFTGADPLRLSNPGQLAHSLELARQMQQADDDHQPGSTEQAMPDNGWNDEDRAQPGQQPRL